MPYVGSDFDDADPEEDKPYGLDFKHDVADGEAIVSASVTIEVVEGTDASASSRLYGVPAVSGSIVRQWARGLQAGVKYRIIANVVTNVAPARELWSHVTCVQRQVA